MAFGKKTTSSSSHDILREKQQEINRLERQADDAVEIVTRTISRHDRDRHLYGRPCKDTGNHVHTASEQRGYHQQFL